MGMCTTRSRIAKIRSLASRRSSNSRYLSQNGCAKKSRPTEVAPLSKSLFTVVVSQSQTEGRGREGKEEAERAANVACVVTRSSFAPTNSIYVVTPECKQRYRGSCQSGGEGKGKRLNKVSVRSSPERLVMTISPVYKQSLEIPSPWLRS